MLVVSFFFYILWR